MENEITAREIESTLFCLREAISRTEDQDAWNDLQRQIDFYEEALATAKAS